MLLERLWRWRLGVMLTSVGGLAALLRFTNLSKPSELVFDEIFYARQAYSLLVQGYPGSWGGEASDFENGDFSKLTSRADHVGVVHPPLGKWMIAMGIKAFGANPYGWRFSSALIGTITVILVALIARRLFNSTLWGGVTGLFLAIDGQHIVQSRSALLDIFLTFFVVLAFGFLLLDRERARGKLLARTAAARVRLGLEPGALLPGLGMGVGFRWYRLLAVISLGCATSVKWSGAYFALFFLVLSVIWDIIDRRAAGVRSWFAGSLVRAAAPALAMALTVLPATYLASYAQWFSNDYSYMRHWAEENPGQGQLWLPDDLRSFVEYHDKTLKFHESLTGANDVTHPYEAINYYLIIQLQPTAYYWEAQTDPTYEVCGAKVCDSAIHGIGNPLLWWSGAVALFYALYRVARRGDVLAATVTIGTLAGWLPWLLYPNRVIFTFYTVAFAPWVMLTVVWALRRIAQPDRLEGAWSRGGGFVVGGFIAFALVLTAFFWPVLTGQVIPHEYWVMHMWLRGLWI